MERINLNDRNRDQDKLVVNSNGVNAKLQDDVVIVYNQDAVELFRFNAQACPFEAQPIRFLVEIYTVGYHRGRLIGREMVKSKIYEMLGPEL